MERALSIQEKAFLLHAERGDCASVKKIIHDYANNPEMFDVNCVDPLNRTALVTAIENENIALIKLLLEEGIKIKDSLLHAISEEYVEAVELLLEWEEKHHQAGEAYSWENIDAESATFTSDITPLMLAAHKNNYEIVKMMLDRGATLPTPHDIRCGCDLCLESKRTDSLRHSQSRINSYRALTSPSLIALSSNDPLSTAFDLSMELGRLSKAESEFCTDYNDMRLQVQNFSTALLDHVRTSQELEIILNYSPLEAGNLGRLKLAIKRKQKMFVAHPNVQQLLSAIWYEGVPGFRRKSLPMQVFALSQLGAMFPVYSMMYMMSPGSKMGSFLKKPFVKFVCHSCSYGLFLGLLSLASQRVEIIVLEKFGNAWMKEMAMNWSKKERGALPGIAEGLVIVYITSLIWAELCSLWRDGLLEYISNLWNVVDFLTNGFYVTWLLLRITSNFLVQREYTRGINPWYPREQWSSYDPMLISEGAFAGGMIFSFLKLVHIFSVNPHLGPIQISLGRMIIDIVKFFFIYNLVLFAFGCGLNQLLWYYAELEKRKCYSIPNGLPDFDNNDKACTIWRRYANLFETSQSLFWASFGLIDLVSFDLTGIKSFTRFWALLLFGSYSVINIIVLLNMLIAMMSNSYQIISDKADTEWKFARSCLWLSYFDESKTVPPPFNIFPSLASFSSAEKEKSKNQEFILEQKTNYENIIRRLIKRYVTLEQKRKDQYGVTEDDVKEIRQDISSFRFELLSTLGNNGMRTPIVGQEDVQIFGKRDKAMERRILKDFCVDLTNTPAQKTENKLKNAITLRKICRAMSVKSSKKQKRNEWNKLAKKNSINQNPIGSTRKKAQEQEVKSIMKNINTSEQTNAGEETKTEETKTEETKAKEETKEKEETKTAEPIKPSLKKLVGGASKSYHQKPTDTTVQVNINGAEAQKVPDERSVHFTPAAESKDQSGDVERSETKEKSVKAPSTTTTTTDVVCETRPVKKDKPNSYTSTKWL